MYRRVSLRKGLVDEISPEEVEEQIHKQIIDRGVHLLWNRRTSNVIRVVDFDGLYVNC